MVSRLLEDSAPLTNTHPGRDKLVRVVQYACMFLVPTLQDYRASKPIPQETDRMLVTAIEKLAIVKNQMSLTRKVLRFGQELPLLIGILRRFKEHSEKPVKMIFF